VPCLRPKSFAFWLKSLTQTASKVLDWLEAQTNEQLNDAPFGMVRMSLDGKVVAYCKSESHITGISPDYAVGKY